MKQLYAFIILLITCHTICAQTHTYSLSLFYESNRPLPAHGFLQLDSLLNKDCHTACQAKIVGYADFVGNAASNQLLSQARATAVKEHLAAAFAGITVLECTGMGEAASHDNGSATGEPAQRRVDVFLTAKEEKTLPKPAAVSKNRVPGWATINTIDSVPVIAEIGQLREGESMVIKGLYFVPGRHVWKQSSEPAVASLLKTLQQYPDLRIEIQGHICCINGNGDALDFDTNERILSVNRARAVYDYLVKHGIDAGRLRYKGYGHSQPKVEVERNTYEEDLNRRVEIKVLEN